MTNENLYSNLPLSSYYGHVLEEFTKSGGPVVEKFKAYDKHILIRPDRWFEALALFECALNTKADNKETENFFHLIFKSYDNNASVNLNDEDYDWYWNKLQTLFDRFAEISASAYLEKGLQYYDTRRKYIDKEKTIYYLNKGDEFARILLGYYYYFGFCGETDKEKGRKLMDSAMTDSGKVRATIYKNYVALAEGRQDEVKGRLDEIVKTNTDPLLWRLIYEQQAYLLETEGDFETAAIYYQKSIDESLSAGFAMMRLGFMHYNKRMKESKSRYEAIQMMEKAFLFGRVEVARSLYYCYFDSGMEWQDNEKGMYWLYKGFEYYDDYCTAQLAYTYLYNDAYKDIQKGLAYLGLAIEMNYADAMLTKAYHYYMGDILEKDIPKALELLDKAIALGSGDAAYRAGTLYEEGVVDLNGNPDYATALSYYEKGAEMNDGQCCGYAGRYYLIGLTVEKDTGKAKNYYEKGVALESPYCMVELAIMYDEGNGVEQDAARSVELLKQASGYNYAHAWYLLGRCYKYALGTDENPDEAIACFEKAGEQKHAKALAELGYCYEAGYGVEPNGRKAMEYMQQSAGLGYEYGEYKLGCYYLYGLEGVNIDYDKAVEWLTKAAEKDYPYAMLEMGDFYLYDYAGKDEQAKAYSYYEKAAEQDVINEGLGLCYEYGFGVERNDAEAFKYYLKAAEDEYVRGKYNAALCYYFGYGVKENFNEAYRWFNEAAQQQHTGAVYYKGKMLISGEGTPQDIPEGISLIKQAAEAGERDAQFDLANCYLAGKGVDENEELAMEWFEKAADNGHEKALKITGRRRRK